QLIKASSSIPYSIVRATQFFEFVKAIADLSTENKTVRLPHVLFQPMAADDVAIEVSQVAISQPINGTVESGEPERSRPAESRRKGLIAWKDPREVVADPNARYYGIQMAERTLVPDDNARLGKTKFEDWLAQPGVKATAASH